MPYYEDLSLCNAEFPGIERPLLAIGWLAPGQPVPKAAVSENFYNKLIDLLEHLWQPAFFLGLELCPFCDLSLDPSIPPAPEPNLQFNRATKLLPQSGNLFIPSEQSGLIYVAPTIVAHYINAHTYFPPSCFQDAVLACPDMRSPEFQKIMTRMGLKSWEGDHTSLDFPL